MNNIQILIKKKKINNIEKKIEDNNPNLSNMERLKSIYQAYPKEKSSESIANKNIQTINNKNAQKKLNLEAIF